MTENYSDQDFNGTSDNISLTFYFDDQKYIQDNYDLFARVLDIGAEITLLQMKGAR